MNKGDVETAWSCYQDQAVLIAQQGYIARGRDAIRAVLEGLISLKLSLRGEAHQLVDAGDIALYCSRWMLVGTSLEEKHVEMTDVSSDVLRRQNDGQELIAVDNPLGTSIVSKIL
jgi:ketosteroid isomerase-like protein